MRRGLFPKIGEFKWKTQVKYEVLFPPVCMLASHCQWRWSQVESMGTGFEMVSNLEIQQALMEVVKQSPSLYLSLADV